MSAAPAYLQPYERAARRHGERFESLLWASPRTQGVRFDAIARLCDMSGVLVLDAGCGRGDLADFLAARGVIPLQYIGLEAVEGLLGAAMRKRSERCRIVDGDFVKEPWRLRVGADVIVFCGSLNTVDVETFGRTLRAAFDAARRCVVFNFLSSPQLAAAEWLTWHHANDVVKFAESICGRATMLEDYLPGDATVAMFKEGAGA